MIEALEAASGRAVSRETFEALERYVALLQDENRRQNLISAASVEAIWQRHIADSAQLARFALGGASWVDIGSGAGLPGIVIALLTDGAMTLVEPRRLRADFLSRVVTELGLAGRVAVQCAKVEKITGKFDVITARAVAPLGKLLGISRHLSHPGTIWLLPKGKSAKSELAEARRNWQCDARMEPSRTDPDSAILVLSNVKATA
ncbi:16S rRNA (guanine(527)-N(7))-methyltransferase RsmG [Sphingomonas sp.]|uniref:16S rRNA (guanine(527)-N(7))-methyltransferase RsmG n=1 Tax=Sphingomonas sp. TaxID=28214 RepID=UPI00286D7E5D|nr:16S rRNA (guanine(527)-N(7))-methyltransferase RsmG [Sphingomonas sp.]